MGLTNELLMLVSIVIIAVLSYYAYLKMAGEKRTASEQIQKNFPGKDAKLKDWKLLLNRSAHTKASTEWCKQNGYQYDASTGKCLYTKHACESASNLTYKSGDTKPFLVWSNGHCVASSSLGTIQSAVCQNKIFKTTFNADMGFHPGDIECDNETGLCTYKLDCTDAKNLDSGKCPTCIIPKGYCNSKGLDYDSMNGLGDCSETDVQAVFEAILGRTITRTYKRNFDNMRKECGHKLLSWNCAKGMGTFILGGEQIGLKTAQKYQQDLVNNFKKNCGGDFTKHTDDFVHCAWSILEFNPEFYLAEMGFHMVDGMLSALFGWTGLPPGSLQKGLGYMVKYGEIAVNGIFRYGEKMVHAIDKYGHEAIAAMQQLGLGPAAMPIAEAIQGLDFMLSIGGAAVKAIAHIGVQAVHLAIKQSEIAMHVCSAAIGAALHPKEFCKNVLNELKDPKKAFSDAVVGALKAMKKAKMLFTESLKIFVNGLKLAGDLLKDVYKKVIEAIENLAKDIEKGVEGVLHALGSLF